MGKPCLQIIGVLQLLNAQDIKSKKVISFSQRVQESVEALSSQAAVAITNKNLIKDEMIKLMSRAGLIRMSFGLETVDSEMRKTMKKQPETHNY